MQQHLVLRFLNKFLEGTFILHLTKEPKDLRSSCHYNLKLKAIAKHNIQCFLYSANKHNFCCFFLLSVLHFHPPHLRRLSDNMSFLACLLVSPCLDPFLLHFLPPSLPPSPWHLFSFLPDSVTAPALCLCVSSLWSAIIPPPPPPPPPPLHQLCQRYISPHHISNGKEKKRVVREETMKEYFWTPPPRWKQKRLYTSGGGSPYILHSPPQSSMYETKKLSFDSSTPSSHDDHHVENQPL